MMVVNFIHEIELAVWKNVLNHLMRIIQASGVQIESNFNSRCAYMQAELTETHYLLVEKVSICCPLWALYNTLLQQQCFRAEAISSL